MSTQKFFTKAAGIKLLRSQGYSKNADEGQCGDAGYGSRLYFTFKGKGATKPALYDHDATLSYLPGHGWTPSYFDDRHPLFGS